MVQTKHCFHPFLSSSGVLLASWFSTLFFVFGTEKGLSSILKQLIFNSIGMYFENDFNIQILKVKRILVILHEFPWIMQISITPFHNSKSVTWLTNIEITYWCQVPGMLQWLRKKKSLPSRGRRQTINMETNTHKGDYLKYWSVLWRGENGILEWLEGRGEVLYLGSSGMVSQRR